MKTKTLITLLVSGLLVAQFAMAGDLSEADKKWSAVVEQKIAAGPTTISTPSEARAKLAQELAAKAGRKYETEKTDNGYRVKVK